MQQNGENGEVAMESSMPYEGRIYMDSLGDSSHLVSFCDCLCFGSITNSIGGTGHSELCIHFCLG